MFYNETDAADKIYKKLRQSNYQVEICYIGQMAIKVATEFKPGAAILNLILLNGSVSKFPKLFSLPFPSRDLKKKKKANSSDHYLVKPEGIDDIADILSM